MRRAGLVVALVLVAMWGVGGAGWGALGDNRDLDVVMVNVPAGDCFILELPGKERPVTVVIDGGDHSGGYLLSRFLNPKEFYAAEAARQQHKPYTIKPVSVDAVIATHVHDDHMSGLTKLLRLGFVVPRAVYWNGYPPGSGDGSQTVYSGFMAACAQTHHPPAVLDATRELTLPVSERVSIRVLGRDPSAGLTGDWSQRTNNASVVLDVRWATPAGRVLDALFCGDMYKDAEQRIRGSIRPKYDLVKLAHHGSAHQDQGFLQALQSPVVFTTPGPRGYSTLWRSDRYKAYFPTTTCLQWLGVDFGGATRPETPESDSAWQAVASSALRAKHVFCPVDPVLGDTDLYATATSTRLGIYHYPHDKYHQLTWRMLREGGQ